MKPIPIPSALFTLNRERLRKRLPANALVVLNANDVMPTNTDGMMGFQQNSDLFYLSGINQEETILLLAPDAFDEKLREVLFVRETSDLTVIWEGHKLTKDQATQRSGIQTVKWLGEFRSVLHGLMSEAEHVFLNSNEHTRSNSEVETRDARFVRWCRERYPLHQYHRLARLMHELRAVKSDLELDVMRRACAITGKGFRRVCRFVKPGVNEAEVEAEFAHEFIRNRAHFAYPPIIASGENSNVLHYLDNDRECQAGQVLLLDVAAGIGNYMSDLTRTIPVSGKFTRRQRQVYDAVLRTFRAVRAAMKPGVTTRDLRQLTERLIEKECLDLGLLTRNQIRKQDKDNPAVKKYFMHGVAHPIGLDVHDVGFVHKPIAAGWVLTCEPGIYVREEKFGVRLENTILVTDGEPIDLMADIPIEADEIETLMAKRK